jgi:uncharacterized protein (DUF433 family)
MSEVRKSEGICGGRARIRNTRIPVWLLVRLEEAGTPQDEILASYPELTPSDLEAAREWAREWPEEVRKDIQDQDL